MASRTKGEFVAVMEAKAYLTDGLDASVKTTTFKFDPLYSGGPAFIDGFDAPAYVDLSTLRVDPNPKALLEHDPDAVVGRLENIDNDGERVTCDAVVGGNELAAKVVEWAKNVAAWSASIGVYRFTDKDVTIVKEKERAEVNGRTVDGPAYIVRNGSLAEGSFVAIGGDGEARTLIARLNKGGLQMSLFKKYRADGAGTEDEDKKKDDEIVADFETDEEKKDDEEEIVAEGEELVPEAEVEQIVEDAVEQAVEEAGDVVPDEVVEEVVEEIVDEIVDETTDPVEASIRASKLAKRKLRAKMGRKSSKPSALAESRRVQGLNALVAGYGKSATRVVAKAISGGWSVDRAERVLRASSRRDSMLAGLKNTNYGATRSGELDQTKVWAAAFAQSLGMTPKRVQAALKCDERIVDASMEKPYRGATFRSIVAASLNSFKPGAYDAFTGNASGWQDCRAECMRARLLGGGKFRATQGFSTISATDVFQLVLQAYLEPSPDTAPRVYSQVARENKVVDFNEVSSYLPTIQGRLKQISETGLIQNVTFKTEEFKRSALPYGAIFTIPEITIINDQIDVFAELLRQLESLGEDCIERDVAEIFWRLVDGDIKDSDSNALVSTTVGNYMTGGSLDEAGLGTAIKMMNSFATGNGVPLASDSLVMLVGSKLAPTALKLANAGYVDFQNGTAYPNVFQGRFKPLEWAYFDAAHARAKKDDGSTASLFAGEKTWVLLRDPSRRPAVCVNKVLGFESPRVEQFDADPAVWGTTYRYLYPYGVSVQYKDAIVAVTNS